MDDEPEYTPAARRTFRWFTAAAIGTWVACGLWPMSQAIQGHFTGWPAVVYGIAFTGFGVAMLTILWQPGRSTRPSTVIPVTLTAIEALCAIAVNLDTAWYLQGTGVGIGLFVIVAAQLPYFVGMRITWAWIMIQTVTLSWGLGGFAPGSLVAGITFLVAAVGFQIFAAASTSLALSEGRARTSLARVNAELNATRELLAESSRTSERLRISRDLHDTLGHHLTALSLQLDVAARLSEGAISEHIHQAHAITRLLLSDVRDVVSALRETSKTNLVDAIHTLLVQPTRAQVHLEMPETLVVEDADKAETILRAVQEILTNTARHSRAENLWLRLAPSVDGIILTARDDGRGADTMAWGNGLRGMRERYELHGGGVDVRPRTGTGFEVHAFMPLRRSA